MATTIIKSTDSDNQAKVDSTGHLFVTDGGQPLAVTGSFTATNPSVGTNGSPTPASSTQAGGKNPSGNLAPFLIDATGALVVTSNAVFTVQNLNISFNEITAIAVGPETSIVSYTAPPATISYLLTINTAGQNRAQYNIYNNGVLVEKQYTNVTVLTSLFDYKTGASSVPGFVIPIGNVIEVKVINAGTSSANFNARLMILEVT